MAGYMHDFSMSNNAAIAYQNGEMPISKWTKSEILKNCGEKAEMLNKLTLPELRSALLTYSCSHHTSAKFNLTRFYFFDDDKLSSIDSEHVLTLISNRPKKEKKEKLSNEIMKAEIVYTIWVGTYKKYKRPKEIKEIVEMKRDDKMVSTANGNKRISSLNSIRFFEEA